MTDWKTRRSYICCPNTIIHLTQNILYHENDIARTDLISRFIRFNL
jgi:hypothetical protein